MEIHEGLSGFFQAIPNRLVRPGGSPSPNRFAQMLHEKNFKYIN
jgi:hypothetical protein